MEVLRQTEFFNGLLRAYPSFAPFTTPAYTNTGFQILAYALEAIKGKSFEEMMQESILRPLGLRHTYYRNAPASEGIIPGSRSESGWDHQLGDADP
jgi:CubicO group peptidase (beta-lactamase class C family)